LPNNPVSLWTFTAVYFWSFCISSNTQPQFRSLYFASQIFNSSGSVSIQSVNDKTRYSFYLPIGTTGPVSSIRKEGTKLVL